MIRIRIAELCMIFIENIANKKLNISPDGIVYAMTDKEISKENDIIQGRIIINQLNDIVEDKKNLSLEPEEGISSLQAIVNKRNKELNINDYLMVFGAHIDYLIKIGIYGVVSLLNKGDTYGGFYSVGNSFDILKMLNNICKNNNFDREFLDIIKDFRKVFEASVLNGKNVSIK
jgi:hypothetical protein